MKSNYKEYEWTKMPWGKYRGHCIKNIPDSYLKWGILNFSDQGMATMFATELQRRNPKLRR